MIERHCCFEYEIFQNQNVPGYWQYRIYNPGSNESERKIWKESNDWFDTNQEARFAAIGYITLLENGA